jgi:hypothetical protein
MLNIAYSGIIIPIKTMSNSNNIYNKTTETRYFPITDETINRLMEMNDLVAWHLYFTLTKLCSFRNGLVGVFSELTQYKLAEALSEQLGKDFQITQVKRALQKLEKNSLVKILYDKPLVILLPQAEFSEPLEDLAQALAYIDSHQEEFNFQVMHRRRDEFFALFKYTPSRTPPAQDSAEKAKALDTIIKNRPSRIQVSAEEKEKAKAWHEELEEEEKQTRITKTTTKEKKNESDTNELDVPFDPFAV